MGSGGSDDFNPVWEGMAFVDSQIKAGRAINQIVDVLAAALAYWMANRPAAEDDLNRVYLQYRVTLYQSVLRNAMPAQTAPLADATVEQLLAAMAASRDMNIDLGALLAKVAAQAKPLDTKGTA